MVWYKTQREVSEYYGKNPNDRSFISRRISKWDVIKKDWGYEIVEKTTWECSTNTTLENKCKELEKEIDRLKAKNEELKKCSANTTLSSNDSDLIDHLALMYVYVEKKNEFMNKVVKSYYDKFSWQYDREWAVEKVYGMYWYTPDEWEKDELEYVRSLIS